MDGSSEPLRLLELVFEKKGIDGAATTLSRCLHGVRKVCRLYPQIALRAHDIAPARPIVETSVKRSIRDVRISVVELWSN